MCSYHITLKMPDIEASPYDGGDDKNTNVVVVDEIDQAKDVQIDVHTHLRMSRLYRELY